MLVVLILLVMQSALACPDLPSCRTAALEAYAAKDFERFHDLAWLAYRKGRQDDPELMLMLARAQSLSGRPGDAIVMLERLAARGVATDAETSEDFATVRALPRWKNRAPSSEVPKAPSGEASKAPPREAPKAPSREEPKAPSREAPKAPSPKSPGALSFTTLLTPSALAYDAVSKRYLIADRQARRVAVVDENTGQVSTLAGAQARFGDVNGMAIDTRQGDLWVITSSEEGASLHRLQLISGRELSAARLTNLHAAVVGMAFVRGIGVVIADERGDISRVRSSGRVERIGALEYVPRTIAADAQGSLWIAAGGPRLARFSVSPFRRVGLVALDPSIPADAPFAVTSTLIHFVVPVAGAYEIHTLKR